MHKYKPKYNAQYKTTTPNTTPNTTSNTTQTTTLNASTTRNASLNSNATPVLNTYITPNSHQHNTKYDSNEKAQVGCVFVYGCVNVSVFGIVVYLCLRRCLYWESYLHFDVYLWLDMCRAVLGDRIAICISSKKNVPQHESL